METLQYFQSHRPTPDPVTAKIALFSRGKSIPGNSTDCFGLFFKPLKPLIGASHFFLFVYVIVWIRSFGGMVQKLRFRASCF